MTFMNLRALTAAWTAQQNECPHTGWRLQDYRDNQPGQKDCCTLDKPLHNLVQSANATSGTSEDLEQPSPWTTESSRLSRVMWSQSCPQAVSSLLIDRFSSARAPEADATDK